MIRAPLDVDVVFTRSDLNVAIQVADLVLCPFVEDRNYREAIYLDLEVLRGSDGDAAMVQFQQVGLKLSHRFRLNQYRRSVEA